MEEMVKNLDNIGGPSLQRRDPSQQRSAASPRRGRVGRMTWPRVRCGEDGEATVHNMKNVVFCFVLLFRYSKDLSI